MAYVVITVSIHLNNVPLFNPRLHANQGKPGYWRREAALVIEDIAVPGNRTNRMSIRPLLRVNSTKTLF